MKPPTHRSPTHPGEMLLEEFLKPMKLTQMQFARHVGWTCAKLSEIIHGKRGVSPDAALTLGEAFKMEPEFWLHLQLAWDVWHAKHLHKSIPPIAA